MPVCNNNVKQKRLEGQNQKKRWQKTANVQMLRALGGPARYDCHQMTFPATRSEGAQELNYESNTTFLFCLFGSLWLITNLILSGLAKDWCRFPSRRLLNTSLWLSVFFLEINVGVYSSLCWLCSLSYNLAPHDSNIDSRACKSDDYFACCICPYDLDHAKCQLKVFG